ncbi:MAG: DUF742 domain-containing protein [Acidimicrobiales bacterium]
MTDQSEATTAPLRVRPYTVTGGRTRAGVELEIETMIRATGGVARSTDQPLIREARTLLQLCSTPLSIAEISAHLDLPLQVVKVLAGDLVLAGRASTHVAAAQSNGRPDLALLERVLDGLQSL